MSVVSLFLNVWEKGEKGIHREQEPRNDDTSQEQNTNSSGRPEPFRD